LFQDVSGREVTERHDHLRPHVLNLRVQVRLAGLDLVRKRVPVAGGPALDHVHDRRRRTIETDLAEEAVEQLARRADKGDPLLVLVEAGGLANE
jgi:hypothetical protein